MINSEPKDLIYSSEENTKIKFLPFLYMLGMTIAFTYRIDARVTNFYLKYIICGIFIILAISLYAVSKRQKHNKIISFFTLYNLVPLICIFLYTILLFLFNSDISVSNLTRTMSTVLYTSITIFTCISAVYLFGSKALLYTFNAMVLSYTFTIAIAFARVGINIFFSFNDNVAQYLEMHDITFAFGFYFIYFALFEDKYQKHHKMHILISALYIYMGFKRIQLIALVVVFIIAWWLKTHKTRKLYMKMHFVGIGIVLFCLLYVWLISSGGLQQITYKYNINMMGRINFYQYISQFYDFNLLFCGIGFGRVSKIFESIANIHIQGVSGVLGLHNDILMIYVELGFIGSILWYWYYAVFLVNKFKKRFDSKVVTIYFLFMCYAFITYATDNTAFYFNFQFVLILVPMCLTLNDDGLCKNIRGRKIRG